MDFNALKKNRTNFADLAKKLEDAAGTKKDYKDNRFWQPTKDKAKNAYAVIRYLPEISPDKLPFEKTFQHAFKGPTGQWFIEDCPTTVGRKDCPACAANSELWNTGVESNKKLASSRKRKLYYVFNIYVVSDPANKEAEGKVFLFKAGKKIFDKIMAKTNPEFEGDTPINIFDLWEGCNFKLRVKEVEGFPNYDASEFDAPSQLLKTDEELKAVFESQYDLSEFVDPKNFKTEEELNAQLARALNLKSSVANDSAPKSNTADRLAKADVKPAKTADAKQAPSVSEPSPDDEGDEDLDALLLKLSGDED